MVAGLVLGSIVPGLNDGLDAVKVGQTSLPIALGLLLMMYPVLAKVRYREVGHITADKRMMTTSLILNWVVGPAAHVHARPGCCWPTSPSTAPG